MKRKPIKKTKGYGIVGTWLDPVSLGGALPQWIDRSPSEAKHTASTNKRMVDFADDGMRFFLCEITIKPIRELRATKYQEADFSPHQKIKFLAKKK